MRLSLHVVAPVLLISIGSFGLEVSRATQDQNSDVAAAQKAAIAALNFRQGDAAGFSRARSTFTDTGWTDFMKQMADFLDAQGAPTFTSTFTARAARVLGEEGGVLHLRIPGSLTQSNQLGKTTYQRFAVEVYVARESADKPIKIQRLEQITCLGASTACN